MKEDIDITTERIDDLVVLLALMQQMDLPAILSICLGIGYSKD